jgi:hypothetical protein
MLDYELNLDLDALTIEPDEDDDEGYYPMLITPC